MTVKQELGLDLWLLSLIMVMGTWGYEGKIHSCSSIMVFVLSGISSSPYHPAADLSGQPCGDPVSAII
jgi:hypothetical protein